MQLPYHHDRYVLFEELAHGGMAVLYRAKYVGAEGFARDVAIKRILPAWSQDRDFITMLIDEAKVLTSLQHQNIVQVFELGIDQGIYFIAMEYVPGLDLHSFVSGLVRDKITLPEKFAYYIVMEMLKGLAFAHNQVDCAGQPLCLVHRDISPQNILLSFQGEVKIADFGIAKGSHRSLETMGMQVKGKYAYMAPEQARGEKVDRRADIFSTGILLYELLTGELLFDGPNDLRILERVRTAKLPTRWEQKIHPAVRAILRRALAESLWERFPTAASFLAELSAFTTDHRIVTHALEFGTFLQDLLPSAFAHAQRAGNTPLPESMQQQLATPLRGATLIAPQEILPRTPSQKKIRWGHSLASVLLLMSSLGFAATVRGDRNPSAAHWVTRTVPIATPVVTQVAAEAVSIPLTPPSPKGERESTALLVSHTAVPSDARLPTHDSRPTTHDAKGTLIVQARPWGMVSINGVMHGRESPVHVQVNAGAYAVSVSQSGRAISARAMVRPSASTICNASFADPPRIWCR